MPVEREHQATIQRKPWILLDTVRLPETTATSASGTAYVQLDMPHTSDENKEGDGANRQKAPEGPRRVRWGTWLCNLWSRGHLFLKEEVRKSDARLSQGYEEVYRRFLDLRAENIKHMDELLAKQRSEIELLQRLRQAPDYALQRPRIKILVSEIRRLASRVAVVQEEIGAIDNWLYDAKRSQTSAQYTEASTLVVELIERIRGPEERAAEERLQLVQARLEAERHAATVSASMTRLKQSRRQADTDGLTEDDIFGMVTEDSASQAPDSDPVVVSTEAPVLPVVVPTQPRQQTPRAVLPVAAPNETRRQPSRTDLPVYSSGRRAQFRVPTSAPVLA